MNKLDKIKKHILESLSDPTISDEDRIKLCIVWDVFAKEIEIILLFLPVKLGKLIASKFVLFIIQFETIIMRSSRPFSKTTTNEMIISMYSKKSLDESLSKSQTLVENKNRS